MSAPRSREPRAVRLLLIGLAFVTIALFLLVPLAAVFVEAFRNGAGAWLAAVSDPDARHAVKLTLLVAAIAVPVNAAFGLAAGWALGKFRFPGRNLVLTLIDLPFAVSPIVAGLVFVLAFGRASLLGGWLADHGIEVVFAVPGIVLATVFVTFPFVARELVPLMQSQGTDEEEAARVLVTLPNVKWALLYGVVLCTARAVGEFGAVSVVSGHVRGVTNTLPLHVETLYNEYAFQGAFAAASLLTLVALAAMLAKAFLSRHAGEEAP